METRTREFSEQVNHFPWELLPLSLSERQFTPFLPLFALLLFKFLPYLTPTSPSFNAWGQYKRDRETVENITFICSTLLEFLIFTFSGSPHFACSLALSDRRDSVRNGESKSFPHQMNSSLVLLVALLGAAAAQHCQFIIPKIKISARSQTTVRVTVVATITEGITAAPTTVTTVTEMVGEIIEWSTVQPCSQATTRSTLPVTMESTVATSPADTVATPRATNTAGHTMTWVWNIWRMRIARLQGYNGGYDHSGHHDGAYYGGENYGNGGECGMGNVAWEDARSGHYGQHGGPSHYYGGAPLGYYH